MNKSISEDGICIDVVCWQKLGCGRDIGLNTDGLAIVLSKSHSFVYSGKISLVLCVV